MIRQIAEKLPETELLAQLAEECAELSKAALKLRRSLDGTNPTPMSREEAKKNLIEEIADVFICIDTVAIAEEIDIKSVFEISEVKMARWMERLEIG